MCLDQMISKGPLQSKLYCESIFLKLWVFFPPGFISAACRMAETLTWKIPLAALKQGHAPVTLSQYWKDKNP